LHFGFSDLNVCARGTGEIPFPKATIGQVYWSGAVFKKRSAKIFDFARLLQVEQSVQVAQSVRLSPSPKLAMFIRQTCIGGRDCWRASTEVSQFDRCRWVACVNG